MTVEERVDGIARWTNQGMRAAVVDMVNDALRQKELEKLMLSGFITQSQKVLQSYLAPGGITADKALNQLLEILDNCSIVEAMATVQPMLERNGGIEMQSGDLVQHENDYGEPQQVAVVKLTVDSIKLQHEMCQMDFPRDDDEFKLVATRQVALAFACEAGEITETVAAKVAGLKVVELRELKMKLLLAAQVALDAQ